MDFLVDADEVLVRLIPRLLPILREICPGWSYSRVPLNEWDLYTTLSPLQLRCLIQEMSLPGFCSGLEADPEAAEALEAIRALGCTVYAVTTPLWESPVWCHERAAWLYRYMGIPRHQVILTEAKYKVHGDFFLDDRPDHVDRWAKRHPQGIPMLWCTAHNRRIKQMPGTEFRTEGWEAVFRKVRAGVEKRYGRTSDLRL